MNMGDKTCRRIVIIISTILISTSPRDTLNFTKFLGYISPGGVPEKYQDVVNCER